MNLESIRHWYLRRVVATGLRTIGYDAAIAMADRLAAGVFAMNAPGRRIAEQRVTQAMNFFGTKPRQTEFSHATPIIRDMYRHIARFWIEALFLDRFLRPASWHCFVTLKNHDALADLARSRRGCVFATTYFGNVAACAYVLGRNFRPIHVLVDFLDQPMLRAWQRDLYNKPWMQPVTREQAADVLPCVLRGGGAVLLVCGADRPLRRAIDVEFLGDQLACPPTLGRLARWFDVPVAAVTCRRDLGRRFGFTFELNGVVKQHGSTDGDTQVVRQTMGALEAAILRDPAQFAWSIPMSVVGIPRSNSAVRPPARPEMSATAIGGTGHRPVSKSLQVFEPRPTRCRSQGITETDTVSLAARTTN